VLSACIRGNEVQQHKVGPNKLELAGRSILTELGCEFREQVLLCEKFLVDVLLPTNIIVQWDGIYWHTEPRRAALDRSQDAYLKKCGYQVLRFTDDQVYNEREFVRDTIAGTIQQTAK
jgi:very-short-patch-repair endonuclease